MRVDSASMDSLNQKIISKLAQEESGKRQHYRPIYSLHKWWARRPGAQFRSIILMATGVDSNLFQMNQRGDLLDSSTYLQSHDFEDLIIFDPFMGGGTTLVEGNRLGAKVIGCDINPVSYWIVRESLRPIDLNQLKVHFKQLEQRVGVKIRDLYTTDCSVCNARSADGMYVFWIRKVNCSECDEEVSLYKRTLLNGGLRRNIPITQQNPATVFCPTCFDVVHWTGEGQSVCLNCGRSFNPFEGTYDQGRVQCKNCGKNLKLVELIEQGQSIQEHLVAIEYWCPICKKRMYKAPDKRDLEKLKGIQLKFEHLRKSLAIPEQRILEGTSSERWRNHGYDFYNQVFSPRQHLAFNLLIDGIKEIPKDFRESFVTVFSNSLEYNNMMTPYNYPHRKLHHLFTYHALPLTTTPVENAVWGCEEKGAGTFVNCFGRYVKAKEYCQNPFDKYKDSLGNIRTAYSNSEKIEAQLVKTFESLRNTKRGALLFCRDSSNIPEIPDDSVDLVITDPPYFDNIHYSELSNFFYVWLRLLVNDVNFETENVPTEKEAIVNSGMNKGEDRYGLLLTSVFRECQRVLKKDGVLAFTFHHTKLRAWWMILSAVRDSGFRITDAFPISSEYKVSPHIRKKKSLDMDLVVFCKSRKHSLKPVTALDKLVRSALERVSQEQREANRDENLLRFLAELLMISTDSQTNYNWFKDALDEFSDQMN